MPAHKSIIAMAAMVTVPHTSRPPSVFIGSSSVRIFSVSEHEKAPSWESSGRRGDSCCGGVFQGPRERLLYSMDPRTPASLEKVCGPKGRLC